MPAKKELLSSIKKRKQFLTVFLLSTCWYWYAPPLCGFAAEQVHTNSLENYLKTLRYDPIAFRYKLNCPLVDGQIGGKKCVFAVSTASMTKIDTSTGRRLKTLKDLGATMDDPFVGRLTNASVVIMDRLILDRIEFSNQPAELKPVDADFVHLPFEGMLGLDFLYRNFCLLDCASERLYVRGEKPSAAVSEALAETLSRSGFTNVTLRGHFSLALDARVNGQNIEMALHTGSTLSLLDASEAKRLDLQTLKRQRTGSLIPTERTFLTANIGKEGVHKTRIVKVNSLEVAGVSWQTLYFGVMNLKDAQAEDNEKSHFPQGTLASDTLAPQDALIDFATRKLWFARQTVPRKHGWD